MQQEHGFSNPHPAGTCTSARRWGWAAGKHPFQAGTQVSIFGSRMTRWSFKNPPKKRCRSPMFSNGAVKPGEQAPSPMPPTLTRRVRPSGADPDRSWASRTANESQLLEPYRFINGLPGNQLDAMFTPPPVPIEPAFEPPVLTFEDIEPLPVEPPALTFEDIEPLSVEPAFLLEEVQEEAQAVDVAAPVFEVEP